MGCRFVLSYNAASAEAAFNEAVSAGGHMLRRLGTESALFESGDAFHELSRRLSGAVFVRHICPVVLEAGRTEELSAAEAAEGLPNGAVVGIQLLETLPGAAGNRRELEERLSRQLEEAGLVPERGEKGRVLTVCAAGDAVYAGVSSAEENLNPRPGGIFRYAMREDTVSRAEFKLTEAAEIFALRLEGTVATDLGAAPGGWTKVLRSHGALVNAVDPALLDERVSADRGVTHYRELAQVFLRRGIPCDILVNDMRMDSRQSCELMAEMSDALREGGLAVVTLKLPEKGKLKKIREACAILQEEYEVKHLRQLYHNRSEVTAILSKTTRKTGEDII